MVENLNKNVHFWPESSFNAKNEMTLAHALKGAMHDET